MAEKRELPALSSIIESYDPVRRLSLVLITHLLPTAEPYLRALTKKFDVDVIGIPYSSHHQLPSIPGLRSIAVPTCYSQVGDFAFRKIRALTNQGESVIVQEVGGYLARFASELSQMESFVGIVEDTNNGHWRYAAEARNLGFPVVSIARSPIKAIEDLLIGDAVVYSVEKILRSERASVLRGLNTLVIGFGKIGQACASALLRRGNAVAVFDVDAIKLMRAKTEGYRVAPLQELLSVADLIIGATGVCSVEREACRYIKNGAILVSASSKQVEFDVASMQRHFSTSPLTSQISWCGTSDQGFYLISKGYPVNFNDNSILGDVLDAIYCELFVCAREIAERRVPQGLTDSWPALHDEVALHWCTGHMPFFRRPTRNHSSQGKVSDVYGIALRTSA